jgi:putative membrane protein
MKKSLLFIAAGAMLFGAACTSTTTDADTNTTAETTTDATVTTDTTSTTTTTTTTTATSTDNAAGMLDAATIASMDDATFMMTVASSNMLEVEAGKMASQNAMNTEVKRFAQMMVDHHTKASQEQKTLATQMNVTLPTALMPMHQSMLDKLNDKTGKDFDEAYMDMMESAHKMDIALFEAKSSNAQAPTVKAFATKGLPMLKSHQAMATKIEDQVD